MSRTIKHIHPRSVLSRMKPYSPGKPIWEVQRELGIEKVTKLASNENPYRPFATSISSYSSLSDRYTSLSGCGHG